MKIIDTIEKLRSILAHHTIGDVDKFSILRDITSVINDPECETFARELVIRALEKRDSFSKYDFILDQLARQVGLFPYITTPENMPLKDRIAYAFHKPMLFGRGGKDIVFHREQAEVYRDLISGQNVILSAPTSFGKSLLIDALVASGKYKNIVVIVPTIALIDETRKRFYSFRKNFKIITHQDQEPSDKNIFILTQERAIDRTDIPDIDLLVIDEFYKLDPENDGDSERSAILNHAFYKLQKHAKQIYFLGPNIKEIPEAFREKFKCILKVSNFNTVVTQTHRISGERKREEKFVQLAKTLTEPTLIYCRSPNQANSVAKLLLEAGIREEHPMLYSASDWIAKNYAEDWTFTKATKAGIGIHHARIPRALAQYNVNLFNRGIIKFLVCTSTLIEGVNTSAKNVVIFENKIAMDNLEFFTFNNIKGRSGRMFRHFVGNVYVFDEPPQDNMSLVDIPFVTQGGNAPESLLIQMDENDLTLSSQKRISDINNQAFLSTDTIKSNSHVDPRKQIECARDIMRNARSWGSLLSWTGYPSKDQLDLSCKLIYEYFVINRRYGVSSGSQLSFKIRQIRRFQNMTDRIVQIYNNDRYVSTIDQAVESALEFERHWARYYFPRYLRTLSAIQKEVCGKLGVKKGDYSFFASAVENLFMSPEVVSLDEYGIPIELSKKLRGYIAFDVGLDKALFSLERLNLKRVNLNEFEIDIIKNALAMTYS